MRTCFTGLMSVGLALTASVGSAADVGPLLKSLRAVGPRGEGHREAQQAWQRLSQVDATKLPEILAGMDGANVLAKNWIRTAVEAVAERALRNGGSLPAERLETFLGNTQHDPQARRLAYELLVKVDPTAKRRLLRGKLNDPSLELRHDAVQYAIGDAVQVETASEPAKAVPAYRRALESARDPAQVRFITERLRRAGQQVDLQRHFGFVVRWKVIGPFDDTDGRGFDTAYPPEQKLDFNATYDGKFGPVRWADYVTKDDYGKIDFNAALGKKKSVAGYAAAEFVSSKPRDVQLRACSFNAVKVWLNGQEVASYKVYQAGYQLDQYVIPVRLRAGSNVILVKVCQNDIRESWADAWGFQLRVCDENGTAVLSEDRQSNEKNSE